MCRNHSKKFQKEADVFCERCHGIYFRNQGTKSEKTGDWPSVVKDVGPVFMCLRLCFRKMHKWMFQQLVGLRKFSMELNGFFLRHSRNSSIRNSEKNCNFCHMCTGLHIEQKPFNANPLSRIKKFHDYMSKSADSRWWQRPQTLIEQKKMTVINKICNAKDILFPGHKNDLE